MMILCGHFSGCETQRELLSITFSGLDRYCANGIEKNILISFCISLNWQP